MRGMKRIIITIVALLLTGGMATLLSKSLTIETDKNTQTPISTIWAEQLDLDNPHPEYPRPNLERDEWKNLNGSWSFDVSGLDVITPPKELNKSILVPFGAMSHLSGRPERITVEDKMWYSREITIPKRWSGQRILLNFEASDWETTLWVNGTQVGLNRGGYNPFSFDITDYLNDEGTQKIEVGVWDPGSTKFISLGKQVHSLYTKCFGMWQTVWMEPVAETHIKDLKITSKIDGSVTIAPEMEGDINGITVEYKILDEGKEVSKGSVDGDGIANLKIESPKLWSPEAPNLYDIVATVLDSNKRVLDEVKSYTGLREFALEKRDFGMQITLNGEDIFQYGPLDQNYWPGGGLTPPSDEAMLWEVQYLKSIGCNMVRMHIKRNPRRWYYHCDREGLIVWQDFICGYRDVSDGLTLMESNRWFDEQASMVSTLYNFPSIAMWIVFNEGWGQHDDVKLFERARALDNTRLMTFASGWDDKPSMGDISDRHDYTIFPATSAEGEDMDRAKIIGECGGISSAIATNNWYKRTNGDHTNPAMGLGKPADDQYNTDIKRVTYSQGESLNEHYEIFVNHLALLKAQGLMGAVYTQLTDMKHEENGFLTFDRKVSKIPVETLRKIHSVLYEPAPEREVLMPLASEWRYTDIDQGKSEWYGIDFDDSSWKSGVGAFGTGAERDKGNTKSDYFGKSVYLRKVVTLDRIPKKVAIRSVGYASEGLDACKSLVIRNEIYINGVLAAQEYTEQDIARRTTANTILTKESAELLKKGKNTIAIVSSTETFRKDTVKFTPERQSSAIDFEIVELVD